MDPYTIFWPNLSLNANLADTFHLPMCGFCWFDRQEVNVASAAECRIRPTLELGKTPVVQNGVVPTGSMLYHYDCCEQNSPPFWQKSPLHILARNNVDQCPPTDKCSASQHKYEDAADKDCAFCLTHGVSAHSVALHVQLFGCCWVRKNFSQLSLCVHISVSSCRRC